MKAACQLADLRQIVISVLMWSEESAARIQPPTTVESFTYGLWNPSKPKVRFGSNATSSTIPSTCRSPSNPSLSRHREGANCKRYFSRRHGSYTRTLVGALVLALYGILCPPLTWPYPIFDCSYRDQLALRVVASARASGTRRRMALRRRRISVPIGGSMAIR